MKRYAIELDMYLFAESDEKAKEMGKRIESLLRRIDDNAANVKKMVEVPFGSLTPREVQL